MKDLTSIELAVLVNEFQELIDARIDKIYQPTKKEIIISMYKTGIGKKLLKIEAGAFAYITEKKPIALTPPGFCMFLRKYLMSSRIAAIQQLDFERILKITLTTKDATYGLFVELFSKGNIILCDQYGIIISALERQQFTGRDVKKGEPYEYPHKDFNFLNFDVEELISKTNKKECVKMLAVDLGIGGKFGEEVLLRAGIDKNAEPGKLSKKEKEALKDAIETLKKDISKPKPVIAGKHIIPFEMMLYEKSEKEFKNSLSQIFDEFTIEEAPVIESAKDKKIKKLQDIIERQEKQIEVMKEEEELNKKKGEAIYEKYQVVEEVLKEINLAKKKFSLKEIKDRLKDHKVVKDISNDGSVEVEL